LASSPKAGRSASPRRASAYRVALPPGLRADAYSHQAADQAPVDIQLGELLDWDAKGVVQWEMQMLRGEIQQEMAYNRDVCLDKIEEVFKQAKEGGIGHWKEGKFYQD